MAHRDPFPIGVDHFGDDERVSYDQVSQSYKLEAEDGEEWEWIAAAGKWIPVTDEAMVEQQRQAYTVEGVDESEPAMEPRKRKAQDAGEGSAESGKAKKQKGEESLKNKAVYVTSLPADVDEDELHQVFSKFGVVAESAEGDKPRIKLYTDEKGNFKGDALIVYFRPESVQIAIDMLDETDFRLGQPVITGPMRVKEADASFKKEKEYPAAPAQAKTKGAGAGVGAGANRDRDRQKAIKKIQQMNNRLADWDDDDPSTLPDTSSRWDKVVVLKHMFTLRELADDPSAILDIKEDVREECDKFGHVTNVVLYDKEDDGVVTVRFGNAMAAQECVKVFDGRWFDRRQIEAYVADGRERFKKSKKGDADEEEEQARLESYSKFIEEEGA